MSTKKEPNKGRRREPQVPKNKVLQGKSLSDIRKLARRKKETPK